jgi:hypothetical protein
MSHKVKKGRGPEKKKEKKISIHDRETIEYINTIEKK